MKQVPFHLSGREVVTVLVCLSTLLMHVYVVRLCIRKVLIISHRPPVRALPHSGAQVCVYMYIEVSFGLLLTKRGLFFFSPFVTKTQIPLVRNYRHCVERNLPSPPAEHYTSVGCGDLCGIHCHLHATTNKCMQFSLITGMELESVQS